MRAQNASDTVLDADPVPGKDEQILTTVTNWTNRLFSFRVTRPQSFRFRSGEFVMIGLMQDSGKPLLCAYSIASPNWDDELEFYSIKVADGPLTSRLQLIEQGDIVVMGPNCKILAHLSKESWALEQGILGT